MQLRARNEGVVAVDDCSNAVRPDRGPLKDRGKLIGGQTNREVVGGSGIIGGQDTHGYDGPFDHRADKYIGHYGLARAQRLSTGFCDFRSGALRQRRIPRHRCIDDLAIEPWVEQHDLRIELLRDLGRLPMECLEIPGP
jgi:hypothetical protein